MARTGKLTALRLKSMKPGKFGDGGGLWLYVKQSGSKSWVFRYTWREKRREMGLGSFDSVDVEEAQEEARIARGNIREGRDPLIAYRARKRGDAPTFAECAERYIAAHEAEWKNAKHRYQWRTTIEQFANKYIGDLPVNEVETADVLQVLEPIWTDKPETAGRLRGRVERVLDWATVHKYRTGDNPARWRGHLSALLPALSKIQKVGHFKAQPWAKIGAFMRDLREREGVAAKALEFTILTAARPGEIRGATWDEIDLEAKTWTVPGEKMKMGKTHRVPLSKQGIKLLQSLPRFVATDLLFPLNGKMLSDMGMTALLRRMKVKIHVHGFRSSFKDWTTESTAYSREVSEMALAHAIGDKVEAAYRHGDLFDKRRKLMQEWADYCDKIPAEESGTVVAIGRGN